MHCFRRLFFQVTVLSAFAATAAAPARGITLTDLSDHSDLKGLGEPTAELAVEIVAETETHQADAAETETHQPDGQIIAQVNLPPQLPPERIPSEPLPPADVNPGLEPGDTLPDRPLPPQLPPIDELLGDPDAPNTPGGVTSGPEETFVIDGIELAGSTVFTTADFEQVFAEYIGRPITFNELLDLRSVVTQRYVEAGFLTSGAFIPPQTLSEGVVTVQVLEGIIEEIEIVGTRRLNPDYIRSRLGLAAQPPINADTLLAGLQRLQIDPLIETVSADLQAGVKPGTSILLVEVTEADSFDVVFTLDNSRSPNIGSNSRQIALSEGNLFGIGDRINLSYVNTDGSNGLNFDYSIPVSPHNTRVRLEGNIAESRVIGEPFDVLGISSDTFQYAIGVDHPLIETPTEDLTLGFSLLHKESQTRLSIDDIGAFPLSPGADSNGETRVTALQFTQAWTKRSQRQVFAARSQFNLGLDILNASRNENAVDNPETAPDSQFLSWRGQGQWVRLLGKESLFFLRSDVQIATDSLLSSEQFGLGGQQTVRGYRQDALLRDNGVLLSAEARFPIARFSEESTLKIAPFLDAGTAWNFDGSQSNNNVLVGTGFGLLWEHGDNLSARIDWGIPLVDIDSTSDSLQDNGLYFSLRYNLF